MGFVITLRLAGNGKPGGHVSVIITSRFWTKLTNMIPHVHSWALEVLVGRLVTSEQWSDQYQWLILIWSASGVQRLFETVGHTGQLPESEWLPNKCLVHCPFCDRNTMHKCIISAEMCWAVHSCCGAVIGQHPSCSGKTLRDSSSLSFSFSKLPAA